MGKYIYISLLALAVVACTQSEAIDDSYKKAKSIIDFDKAFNNNASCGELFEIRNEIKRQEPYDGRTIDIINDRLRSVGCFMPSSTRQ